jgi:RHS repeat-associated protein
MDVAPVVVGSSGSMYVRSTRLFVQCRIVDGVSAPRSSGETSCGFQIAKRPKRIAQRVAVALLLAAFSVLLRPGTGSAQNTSLAEQQELEELEALLAKSLFSWMRADSVVATERTVSFGDRVALPSEGALYPNARSIQSSHELSQSSPGLRAPAPLPSSDFNGREVVNIDGTSRYESSLPPSAWQFLPDGSASAVWVVAKKVGAGAGLLSAGVVSTGTQGFQLWLDQWSRGRYAQFPGNYPGLFAPPVINEHDRATYVELLQDQAATPAVSLQLGLGELSVLPGAFPTSAINSGLVFGGGAGGGAVSPSNYVQVADIMIANRRDASLQAVVKRYMALRYQLSEVYVPPPAALSEQQELAEVEKALAKRLFSWMRADSVVAAERTVSFRDRVALPSEGALYPNARSIQPSHELSQPSPELRAPAPLLSSDFNGREVVSIDGTSRYESSLPPSAWQFLPDGSASAAWVVMKNVGAGAGLLSAGVTSTGIQGFALWLDQWSRARYAQFPGNYPGLFAPPVVNKEGRATYVELLQDQAAVPAVSLQLGLGELSVLPGAFPTSAINSGLVFGGGAGGGAVSPSNYLQVADIMIANRRDASLQALVKRYMALRYHLPDLYVPPSAAACGDGVVTAPEACDTAATALCSAGCGSTNLTDCSVATDCPNAQTCPASPNGAAFGLDPFRTVCTPQALCANPTPPSCGTTASPCGECQCVPNCSGKQCGDDPSDGCGGVCFDLCADGQLGCTGDTDCRAGSVCSTDSAWRFAASAPAGARACWPGYCEDIDPRRIDCGPGAPCGQCDPMAQNKCFMGTLCPTGTECAAGTLKNAAGSCVPAVDPAAEDTGVATSAVGALPGQFQVTSRGAAAYSVPITLPPGRGGFAPALSLDYNSSAGNGLLGLGWSLNGLSAIGLCSKTAAQDLALDEYPGFCLDGERIFPARYENGRTEWETEFESFTRISSAGNFVNPVGEVIAPTFTVEHKDGRTMTYGGHESARLKGKARIGSRQMPAAGAFTMVRSWALSKVQDRAFNAIEIRYSVLSSRGADAELLPRWIGYNFAGRQADDAVNEVVFDYEEGQIRPVVCRRLSTAFGPECEPFRPDELHGFSYGQPVSQTRLLRGVSVRAHGEVVRRYRLSYEKTANKLSALKSISECSGRGASEVCRPPTSFEYNPATPTFPNDSVGLAAPQGAIALDYNGDGYDDFASFDTVEGKTWRIFFGSTSGLAAAPSVTFETSSPGVFFAGLSSKAKSLPAAAFALKMDGAGGDDLLVPVSGGSGLEVFSHGSSRQALDVGVRGGVFVVLDLDGDGLRDLAHFGSSARFFYNRQGAFVPGSLFSEGASFSFDAASPVINVENGRQCILGAGNRLACHSSERGGVVATATEIVGGSVWNKKIALDANGDGLSDLLLVHLDYESDPNKGRFQVLLNSGAGVSVPKEEPRRWRSGPSGDLDLRHLVGAFDFDQDGRADLLEQWRGYERSELAVYEGPDFDLRTRLASDRRDSSTPVLLDANGDGQQDYLWEGRLWLGQAPTANLLKTVVVRHHATDVPDRVEITYSTGVAAGTYTSGNVHGCGAPGAKVFCPARLPKPVVRMYERAGYAQRPGARSDPTHYEVARYTYGPAVVDREGRGFLGFASRDADVGGVDGIESMHMREVYNLSRLENPGGAVGGSYPYADQPVNVVTTWSVPNNTLTQPVTIIGRREVVRTPDVRTSPRGGRFTVVTAEEHTYSEGSVVDQRQVARTFDGYGNLKTEDTLWPLDGRASWRGLQYLYENNPGRVASWQVDLVEVDRRADYWGETPIIHAGTRYAYESDGLVKEITERDSPANDGLVSTILRDARRNIATVSQLGRAATSLADLRVWQFAYDDIAGVYVKEQTNPEAHPESFLTSYADGLVRRHRDANQRTTSFRFDGFGRLVSETQLATGIVSSFEYAPSSWRQTGPVATNGAIRVTQRTSTPTLAETYVSSREFDTAGRLVADSTQAASDSPSAVGGISSEREYDIFGRLLRRSRPHVASDTSQGVISFAHDSLGRVTRAVTADGRAQTWAYASSAAAAVPFGGPLAKQIEMTETPSGRRFKAYDALGTLVETREGLASSTRYTHGAGGFLLAVQDAAGNVTSWTPDFWGRVKTSRTPDTGDHTYEYSAWNELQLHQHNTEQHRYTYDGLGRPTSLSNSDGTALWVWDRINDGQQGETRYGELMAAYTPDGNVDRYSYGGPAGALDEVTKIISHPSGQTSLTTAFEYDAFLRPSVVHYPGTSPLSVRYRYDEGGNHDLVNVSDANDASKVFWARISSYQGYRPKTVAYGDGTELSYTYSDLAGWVDEVRVDGAGPQPALLDIGLTYDGSGNVKSVRKRHDLTESAPSVYSYDELDRLRSVTRGSGPAAPTIAAFEYTSIGNIKSKSAMGTYTYGDPGQADGSPQRLPHAVRRVEDPIVGVQTYRYDNPFGRMSSREGFTVPTGEQSFTYFASGKLRSIMNADEAVQRFAYGPSGDRVLHVDAFGYQTLHAGGLYERSLAADGALISETRRVMVEGQAIAELRVSPAAAAETRYLHRDHLGSVVLVTDQAGVVTARAEYGVFGQQTASTGGLGSALGFTGHRQEVAAGLVDMGGRFYDPALGRFITPDPIIPDATFSQAFDRYAYAYNNPGTLVDPTGHAPTERQPGGGGVQCPEGFCGNGQTNPPVQAPPPQPQPDNSCRPGDFCTGPEPGPSAAEVAAGKRAEQVSAVTRAAAWGPSGTSNSVLQAAGRGAPVGPRTVLSSVQEFFGRPASRQALEDISMFMGGPAGTVSAVVVPSAVRALPGLLARAPALLARGASLVRRLLPGTTMGGPQILRSAGAAANRIVNFSTQQLQSKFKHASAFGVNGPWNKANAAAFESALQSHVDDAATLVIQGTYHQMPVTHFVNPTTGLNVMKGADDAFISAFRLGTEQLKNVLTRGSL